MSAILYDPDNWLTSLTRALRDYVRAAFDPNLYDVQMSFPDPQNWPKDVPLAKTLIHFEMDDEQNPILGMGQPGTADFDLATGDVTINEADIHIVNFDVGIWTSAQTGGPSTRMEVRETLSQLFSGPQAKKNMAAATSGIEIREFSGGRTMVDRINGVPIFRMMDMSLVVRVFSRKTIPPVPAVDGFIYQGELIIDDSLVN